MSDENQILHSMELVPTVLELIIIGYITRKEITFQRARNDNKSITISDDGTKISAKKHDLPDFCVALSPTPFSQSRLCWKVQLLWSTNEESNCYVGILLPEYKIDKKSADSITDSVSGFYRLYKIELTRKANDFSLMNSSGCFWRSENVVLIVDLIKSSFSICEEICGNQRFFPIAKNIADLEQYVPFVSSLNNFNLIVTSY